MNILVELEKLRMPHHRCFVDPQYSCPKETEEGCWDENAGEECTCGADKHNKLLNSIIDYIKENYGDH